MTKRMVTKVFKAAQPVLAPDEQVEVATPGSINRTSTARRAATSVAVAAATTVLSGGMATAWTQSRKFGLALTNKRFLVLDSGAMGRISSKVLTEIPRSHLRAKKVRDVLLVSSYNLFDHEGNRLARMSIPGWYRKEGRQLADALGEPYIQQG